MFFPHLMNISSDDLVLEIGPGAYPYWRSDCLIDKFDNEAAVDVSQFGGLPQQTLGKPLFKMEHNELPFKDKSFDYVICTHVLEHVPHDELPGFVSEIERVAKRAYIEFPRLMYELVYNFDVHLNLMDIVDGVIICLPKSRTRLNEIKRFTDYGLYLRGENVFALEQLNLSVVAVGKEFNAAVIPLKVCQDEEEFFCSISLNFTEIQKKKLSWRIKSNVLRIRRRLSKERDRTFFEGLLK